MSYSGDAAEQVVRMSLEGAEVAARITGQGAKEIALLLYAVLKDQKKTKGKTRLTNMLKSGKELEVFAVYCVLKDRDASDGITDVMVRAEDASKVNRIFERFQFTSVDMASVRSEIERSRAKKDAQKQEPERAGPERSKEDLFLDALMSNPSKDEAQTQNPTEARVAKSRQSVPSSKPKEHQPASPQAPSDEEPRKRPSVRQELKDIRSELDKKAQQRTKGKEPIQHKAPPKKKKKER